MEESSINLKSEPVSLLILIVMGLASLLASFMGFMILGMGEACCHINEPGGMAYACFAWAITLTLVVFLLYAVWSPAKPIIFWIWAGTIITSLTAMNMQNTHSGSTEFHLGQSIHSLVTWPLSWAVVGIVGLSHIEARFRTRTWGKRSVQGA
jgi:hypothetical protein